MSEGERAVAKVAASEETKPALGVGDILYLFNENRRIALGYRCEGDR